MQPLMQKPELDTPAATEGCPVPFHSDSLHDFSSPVNQLSTMLALLQKRSASGGDDQVIFDLILSSAARLRAMTAGLQNYVRTVESASPFRICEGEAVLDAAVSSVGPAYHDSRAKITHDPLPRLFCDPGQIASVLASLIDNAIKFQGEAPAEIHISAVASDQDWIFSVHDNGIGIEPKNGDRIFHLFKRLNGEKYPGAGIGLAIARAVIARHGGRIWLGDGPGTTIHFTLPRALE